MNYRCFLPLLLTAFIAASGIAKEKEKRTGWQYFTIPANDRPEYALMTYSVKPPQGVPWRLVQRTKEDSWITFVHAEFGAALIAFWEPVFDRTTKTDPADLAQQFFQEHMAKRLELSPDYRVDSVARGNPEKLGDLPVETWRVTYTGLATGKVEEEKREGLVFAHASTQRPDLFVFYLMTPRTNDTQRAACEEAMRAVVASVRLAEYQPADVAIPRMTRATARFASLAGKESASRDPDAIRRARVEAESAAENASTLQSKSAIPWNALGYLATFDADGLRFGKGFDAKRAEEMFQRSIEKRRSFQAPHENLAQLYASTGRDPEAEAEWKKIVEIDPWLANSHYELGRFYQKRDRDKEALASFREALRLWHGAEVTRKELEKEIKELQKKVDGK